MTTDQKNTSESKASDHDILVIDDDPISLDIVSGYLEEQRYTVLIAEDGESGVKRADYARPDLILLDIMMPGMDGYETCRRLKEMESTKDIPVIFMTALADTEHKIRGFEAGGVDYVTKPVQREEVVARAGVHLRIRELTTGLRNANEALEKRVEERTVELRDSNEKLALELAERTRAEEELARMNERFALAANAARLGVWDWDILKNELVWDDMMYALYGITKDDFSGAYEAWLQGVHPDDRARSNEISKRAQQGEKEYDTEFRVVWPDGSIHWLKAFGKIIRDRGGTPVRMTGINHDITGLKQAEAERLAHLRFFENLDRINRAIQGANDLDQMMNDTLETTLQIFDCDRSWLFSPCDPDALSFRVPMEITRPEYPGAGILNTDMPMPPDMALNLRETLESEGPVTYAIGTDKPVNKVSAEQFGVQSMIMVALYPKSGKPWAFGLHQCSCPRLWTSEEQRLFQEIGRRLADSLTGLLSHRDLQESEEALRQLNEELDQRVKDRTKELERRNHELETMNKSFVGRELKMAELKKRISELEKVTMIHDDSASKY